MPWEGVAAERAGVELNVFKLRDYGVTYCYSPVLAAHPQTLAQQPDLVRSFLAATARGFACAAANAEAAGRLLCAEVAADAAAGRLPPLPEPLDEAMVLASQRVVGGAYLDAHGQWGRCDCCRGLGRGWWGAGGGGGGGGV
jgi:hypothetical protein